MSTKARQGHTDTAISLYQQAYAIGDVDAGLYLAQAYESLGQKDLSTQWYEKIALQNNETAMAQLGRLVIGHISDTANSFNIKICLRREEKLFNLSECRKAAIAGNPIAQYKYAKLIEKSMDNEKVKNYSNIIFWNTAAAEQQHRDAQLRLINYYFAGQYTLQNFDKALYWSQRAKTHGYILLIPELIIHRNI